MYLSDLESWRTLQTADREGKHVEPDDLTSEELLVLGLAKKHRKPSTGTVRRTGEQLASEAGLTWREFAAARDILIEVGLLFTDSHGRLSLPLDVIEHIVEWDSALTSVMAASSRAQRGRAGALARDSRTPDPQPPSPLKGGGGGRGPDATHPIENPPKVDIPVQPRGRTRGPRKWTGQALAQYFQTRVLQFSPSLPGVVNKAALSKNFNDWMREGHDGESLRDMVDFFALHMARYTNQSVPVWKSFLARRAQIVNDMQQSAPKDYTDDGPEETPGWSFE